MLLSVVGACVDEPPFTFRVEHLMTSDRPAETLFEMQFSSYSDARSAGPFLVDVTEDASTATLSFDVGYCARVASCAGPISLEHLGIRLTLPGYIGHHECVGLDGAQYGGIDRSGTGDCAE